MSETEIDVYQIRPSTSAYQIIGTNSGATANQYLTLTAGSNITITPSGSAITITSSSGSGTVGSGTSGQNAVYNGSTSITSGVTMSMNNTKITSLANGTASTDAAAFGQLNTNAAGYIKGTIVQRVEVSSISQQGITSTTFAVASNWNTNITPLASTNIIRVTWSGVINPATNGQDFYMTIKRGSIDLSSGTNGLTAVTLPSNVGNSSIPVTIVAYDSPATTSSITYGIYAKSSANTLGIGHGSAQVQCSMILEEIAA